MTGKSFAVDSNSPLFEYDVQQYIEKPNLTQIIKSYTYEKIGDNIYNFTIYFDLSNSFYMDRIIFSIYCSNCVLEINGQKYEAYSPDSETKVRIMIKKEKKKSKIGIWPILLLKLMHATVAAILMGQTASRRQSHPSQLLKAPVLLIVQAPSSIHSGY